MVVVSMRRGPLGRLGVGSEGGDIVGGATSERTGARTMRSRAVAGTGGSSIGAASALATGSSMAGKATRAEDEGVGGV